MGTHARVLRKEKNKDIELWGSTLVIDLRFVKVALCGLCAVTVLDGRPVGAQQDPTAPAHLRPSVNFYGLPGLIDMPSGQPAPEGEFTTTIGYFGGIFRNTLAFQLSPRISGTFRYSVLKDWNSNRFDTYYDRSFDLRYQLFYEGRYRPAVSIGLQDLAGTGVSAAEYIAATKTIRPGLTVTGGLGWGRLGSYNSIGSVFGSDRPEFIPNDTGGELSVDQWFRGPVAPFAGLEWRPNEKWTFKFEYSSDDYVEESQIRDVIEKSSPFNFGAEYQWTDTTRVGVYSLYGEEIGVMASFALNPARAPAPPTYAAPGPLAVRPAQSEYPELWTTDWANSPVAEDALGKRLRDVLDEQGIKVLGLSLTPYSATLQFDNRRYRSTTTAVGRVARAMALVLPVTVETFNIVPVEGGLPVSRIVMRRTDLEKLEVDPNRAAALRPLVGITSTASSVSPMPVADVYPRFDWTIAPYLRQAFFDPQNPALFEVGVRARASYEFRQGLIIAGSLAQEIYSDLDKVRVSASNLPPVRTSGGKYEQGSEPYLENLTLSYARNLGNDFYGRASTGYFERMFGGVSGEVLWKPVSSPLGLGLELNYAKQRDPDSTLNFIDYDVLTGHASAYYDWGNGFLTQVDVGRYLAGDVGATLTIEREFANGWRVGAFATLTDVSSEDFGEGSFDKGITFSIPVDWAIGRSSRSSINQTIRPIRRDGGARMNVPGRLYDRVRGGDLFRVEDEWGRIWR